MNHTKRLKLAQDMLFQMLEKKLPFDFIAMEIFERYQIGEISLKRMIERKEKGLAAIAEFKKLKEFQENGTQS